MLRSAVFAARRACAVAPVRAHTTSSLVAKAAVGSGAGAASGHGKWTAVGALLLGGAAAATVLCDAPKAESSVLSVDPSALEVPPRRALPCVPAWR